MKLDLEELKKRLRSRSALAITLQSGRIAVSLVRREGGVAASAPSLSVPLGDQAVLNDPAAAGRELALLLDSAGIRERNCVVCVPPAWALTSSTDLPEVGIEDLRGYLELRAEREFSMSAGDLRLGYCAYSLPGGQRRATVAALTAKQLEAVEQMLETAHRRATSISLAVNDCLSQSHDTTLHFLTNGDHTDLVVTAGGGVAGLRSLPSPSGASEPQFDSAAFCREVRITIGRLPSAVRQQLRRAEFAGPSARKLCTATRYGLARLGIETPGSESLPPAAGVVQEDPGAAVESARRILAKAPVPFEFLVPETNRWQAVAQRFNTSGRRRLLVIAGAVVFLPVLAFFIRSEFESHLQSQWDGMAATAADLTVLQQKIHQFRPWFEPAPQGLQVIESLVTAFPDAGDIWAKSVQVGAGYKVTCTGFARTQPALMALMDRMRARHDITALQVQQIRGENPIQFTLSYQWEPQYDR